MTINELYQQLANKNFQDYMTGNLFFPAYMYIYDPLLEYEIENEILEIKERLHRPNNYLDILILDIFEEFLNYLSHEMFGKNNKLDFFIQNESTKKQNVDKALKQEAYKSSFFEFLDNKIQEHLKNAENHEVAYVFMKGFGNAFPYLRTSRFFNNFEKYIKGYKLIIFYPGKAKEYYSLFGLLKEENLYRAIKLINA